MSRRPVPASARLLACLALAGGGLAGGCALILGFDETTLRPTSLEDGPTEAGPLPDTGGPVDAGESSLTVSPTSAIVRRGATVTLAVDVARGNAFSGEITLAATDLPAGVTASAPPLAPPARTATLTISATKAATLGQHTIKVGVQGAAATAPNVDVPLLVADPAGSLDETFDGDGMLADLSRGTGSTFFSLALQADGKIVAGGIAALVPTPGWIVRRYTANGATDATFSAANTGLPTDGELRAVAVDGLGRIVCVGSSVPTLAAIPTLTVARLTSAGALDTTFGGGIQRLPVLETPTGSIGLAVAIQADGMIVVVGARNDGAGDESGLVTRFKADGARDMAFNGGAPVVVPNTRFVGIALEASGSMVVAGSIGTSGGALPSYVLTRRTALGGVDATFGDAGTSAFGNTYRANAFMRLKDGTFALVGDVRQGVAGYTGGIASATGAPVFARAFANLPGAGYFGVAAQDQSRIVVTGHTAVANGEARVDRLFVDGGKDGTFSDAGVAIIEPSGVANGFDVTLFAAAVQADGRILAAGNRSNAGAVIYRLWP